VANCSELVAADSFCYVPLDKQDAVKEAIGLPQMPMAFDRQGSAVIYVGDKPDFI